ncbi:hypothetical protein APR50_10470 [Variovorax paradoxus]|jgi:hypothetical protein|uniref:virion core protein, T7 gp14 family n=1 Tax=Variovorax paradoxus TaxID=34073 RepID=UPI0006E533CA|nr:hypothetical protein APR52_20720 [Variovorax paradoxus]KPV08887.1 hypothetical protein APR50_10470 [Variovorax paradoxus]KPV11384.1 hypothetical protein APR49_09345 [Variovorax paradoxus]KPV23276.1 hypothetical protein APR51_07920 [Variovorax paradoxus]KPV31158.1 hypothetical protein APR48_17685 [Variovorax paradoxus]
MGIEVGQIFQGMGAGVQAMGAYSQAKAEQASLRAEAQVQANNSQLSAWQAEDAIERGDMAASEALRRGAQVKGSQRAALAANGVDLGYGSALQVITDTDYLSAVDAAQLQQNAAREAWGYRMQARQYADRSVAAATGASQIRPWLSAGTSLLTSATQAARTWYSGNRVAAGAGADGFSAWAFRSNRGMGD